MKKLFIPLILMIAASSAYAQQDRSELTFGLKAGVNWANVYDEEGEDFEADAKLGFAGGAFIGIPIGEVLGFQPEFIYSQKGFQGSGTFLGSSYEFKRTTSYLDIPLQLQLKPSEFVTFVVGPQYSFLLSRNDEFESGTFSGNEQEEFENDNLRKNLAGFVFGLDVYSGNVVFSGRAGWDVQQNNGDGTSDRPRYKNQWVQFTLGVSI